MNLVANYVILPNAYKQTFTDFLKYENIECTFISTTGLFLKEGQTTCLIVSDSFNTKKITDIIKKTKAAYKEKSGNEDCPNVFFFTTPVLGFDVM